MLKLAHREIQSRMKDLLSKKDKYDKKNVYFCSIEWCSLYNVHPCLYLLTNMNDIFQQHKSIYITLNALLIKFGLNILHLLV